MSQKMSQTEFSEVVTRDGRFIANETRAAVARQIFLNPAHAAAALMFAAFDIATEADLPDVERLALGLLASIRADRGRQAQQRKWAEQPETD